MLNKEKECPQCRKEMVRQEWSHRWVCYSCGWVKPFPAVTRGERFRTMNDEEWAAYFANLCSSTAHCDYCPLWETCPNSSDLEAWLQWVQEPMESEENEEAEG